MTIVAWSVIVALSLTVARRIRAVPGPLQVVLETAIGYVANMADQIIGPKAPRYYPLLTGLFLYILVCNLMGLVPGFESPTANPNTTFALALIVFLYYNVEGIRANGLRYFRQFAPPKLPWVMAPISVLLVISEIVTFLMRPLSLGLRLFCNIYSKELFLAILAFLIIQFGFGPTLLDKVFTAGPFLLRPFILILGVFIGFIQALIFIVLSMSYIAGALHVSEH
jgi:F-type H+-transporting ATPase subunit a